MINLIPLIVTGGVIKKFSDSMLSKSSSCAKKKAKKLGVKKPAYPSKYRPF